MRRLQRAASLLRFRLASACWDLDRPYCEGCDKGGQSRRVRAHCERDQGFSAVGATRPHSETLCPS